MNRRIFVFSLAAGVASVVAAGTVSAKDAGWDGTWSGMTAKGGQVVVQVAGGRVSYTFRGAAVAVNSAAMGGNTLTLKVGALNGAVRLTRTGPTTASYSYSDSQGGSATATLTRR